MIAKIEYAKLKLELPLQAWPFWRARTLVRGQFFESPCRHFLGVAPERGGAELHAAELSL